MKNSSVRKIKAPARDDHTNTLDAIQKAFAVIEFEPTGIIRDANENFLNLMGYSRSEIVGQHHRLFVDSHLASSLEYRRFWDELQQGQPQTREFKRLTKQGQPVWIKGSYLPIQDGKGKVSKVLKVVQDYTADRLQQIDKEGQVTAISKSLAVIEFTMDGMVISANANFLATMGFAEAEVIGKHHSGFVAADQQGSADYRNFWAALNRGEFQKGEFKRVGKNGREIWLQASYNPIMDVSGKPFKVVKYATDITVEKNLSADYASQIEAIHKAQAVIEFNLDGTIIRANDNFLKVMGYTLDEIKGKHHSMFADETFKKSAEYRAFWEKLNRGEYDFNRYKRLGKFGKEIWIQASYNPIFDLNGKPYKVVKYATDVTAMVEMIKELSSASSLLTAASEQLHASASQMSSHSQKTSSEATTAATRSDFVSRGVEEVATNTEEMQASIKEIARNASESSHMSNQTRNQAQSTNVTIQKLGDSSREIGNVIKVISSIAQQTNLLALNATIEAARAGDAGRGFAVVANEVKELAKQTARATEEITSKIGAIQADSQDAVKAISGISSSIEKLNGIAGAIASSVEEQSATTTEVARVIRESNTGVQGISENIKSVQSAATLTSEGAGQVMVAAQSLQDIARRLQNMVSNLQKN